MDKTFTVDNIVKKLKTKVIGQEIVYLNRTTSTMDVARKKAEGRTPEGTVVVAEQQTSGRGRFQRVWISPPGVNLYFSVVLYPKTEMIHFIHMVTTLAIIRGIKSVTGLSAAIKWPNDVKIKNKKISGVLVESTFSGQELSFLVVGVGINVNFDPNEYPEIVLPASSLMQEVGQEVNRLELFTTILYEFEQLYLNIEDGQNLQKEWRDSLETLGLRIRVRQMSHVEEGIAIDTDLFGNLLLRRDDNSIIVLYGGEVTTQI